MISPTRRAWYSARNRCRNPSNADYPNYGGRGIIFSKKWDSFEVFVAELGERPPGTSLDRINNNKGYQPGNCRWATASEQSRNRDHVRNAQKRDKLIRQLVATGKTQAEVARLLKISPSTVCEAVHFVRG